ncbi:MAG TPA: S53 family peptidase [Ktedonobacteraceae bacterium]
MHALQKSTILVRVPLSVQRLLSAAGGILLVILLVACGGSSNTQNATPTAGQLQFSTINLKLPAAAYSAPTVGPLPASTAILLGVSFKVNLNALPTVGDGTKIPTGQDTDLEKYANQYGISDATYQKIEKYLGIEGVTLNLGKLHSYMSVKAQAGTIEKLFQTQFIQHKLNNRTYYLPATAPKLPTFVMGYVLAITGLETYSTIKPGSSYLNTAPGQNTGNTGALTASLPNGARQPASANCSPRGGVVPGSIADAYGYSAFWKEKLYGQHMTINLVELGGVLNSDMQNYFACVGYPGNQLHFVNVDGAPRQASDEATLDIEMIAGLAPGATIVDYQSDGQTLGTLLDELQAIVDANAKGAPPGSAVSISYGAAEDAIDPNGILAIDQTLQTLTQTEHMYVFVASGDCGAFVAGQTGHLDVSYPASSPWATAVGGTELAVNRQGARGNEIVWGAHPAKSPCDNQWGSGGGVSSFFKRPNWQAGAGVNNQYSNGARQVPDISAIAYDLPVYFQGQWVQVVGTSAATPIWASGMALVQQALITHQQFYVHGTGLFYAFQGQRSNKHPYFDIVTGDNQYYKAVPNWDYTTGWGTPNLVDFYGAILDLFHS